MHSQSILWSAYLSPYLETQDIIRKWTRVVICSPVWSKPISSPSGFYVFMFWNYQTEKRDTWTEVTAGEYFCVNPHLFFHKSLHIKCNPSTCQSFHFYTNSLHNTLCSLRLSYKCQRIDLAVTIHLTVSWWIWEAQMDTEGSAITALSSLWFSI